MSGINCNVTTGQQALARRHDNAATFRTPRGSGANFNVAADAALVIVGRSNSNAASGCTMAIACRSRVDTNFSRCTIIGYRTARQIDISTRQCTARRSHEDVATGLAIRCSRDQGDGATVLISSPFSGSNEDRSTRFMASRRGSGHQDGPRPPPFTASRAQRQRAAFFLTGCEAPRAKSTPSHRRSGHDVNGPTNTRFTVPSAKLDGAAVLTSGAGGDGRVAAISRVWTSISSNEGDGTSVAS